MAIRTTDTNPALSTGKIREVLLLELEIDKHLLEHLLNGKASYLVTATDRSVVMLLIQRYQKQGWTVTMPYEGSHLYRLEFEDPDQIANTQRLRPIKSGFFSKDETKTNSVHETVESGGKKRNE